MGERITRSQAIANLLSIKAQPDLGSLYHIGMECQVNVAQDDGTRVDGDFRGKKWHGWTDGHTTWKSFRIPYKAMSDPEYTDNPMTFDLEQHAEGIGMTGWDWVAKRSRWVAFDFDAMLGHSDNHNVKLSPEEMEAVAEAALALPWVTLRKSTSGKGLHIYVFLDPDSNIEVKNHCEHAALARSILGKMSALTGYSFGLKVDACGGNMWVWHRKTGKSDGLSLIRAGDVLPDADIPSNWREHVKVIRGRTRRVTPVQIEAIGKADSFEDLTSQHPRIPLDEDHRHILTCLQDQSLAWEWDQDNHMLITHTSALKTVHETLGLKGYYDTSTSGSSEINCFAFPLRKGAWVVRRYTPGVQEHPSWEQDGGGWTRCYFNREPDLATICRAFGALEHPKGGFVFREAELAQQAAVYLGVTLEIAPALRARRTIFKQHKDGRLIVEIERQADDRGDDAKGYLPEKAGWTKIMNMRHTDSSEPDGGIIDDVTRHLVSPNGDDIGWAVASDGRWHYEPLTHVRAALTAMGMGTKDINHTIGGSVFKPWRIVNKPFQPEYPGDREWNRDAAQLRYPPSDTDATDLKYPTWMKILNHCGSGLDEAVQRNSWCRKNGILTGGDYLKCWIASVIQYPDEPLPYLFFYNPDQNTGKSTFHEMLPLLFTRGVVKAESALTNGAGFNGELKGAVVCTVEEIDLAHSRLAYSRMKDWVTGREVLIHSKYETPYSVVNTTHWIQCSNEMSACPVFSGDTRVTMGFVKAVDPMDMIPKMKLLQLLREEAQDFTTELLRLEIPETDDRLRIPTVNTDDKVLAQRLSMGPVEAFITECCRPCQGAHITFSEFYEKFVAYAVSPDEASSWTKIRVGRSIPVTYPKGRLARLNAQVVIGNLTWATDETTQPTRAYVLKGDFLREVNQ